MKTILEYIVNNHVKQPITSKYGKINDNIHTLKDIQPGDYFEVHEVINGEEVTCIYGLSKNNVKGTSIDYDFCAVIDDVVKINSTLWLGSEKTAENHIVQTPTEKHVYILDSIAKYIKDNDINVHDSHLQSKKIGIIKGERFIPNL